ncbi:MAGE-domain-containing protein, partial [Patellaria atrata CBS 101060]
SEAETPPATQKRRASPESDADNYGGDGGETQTDVNVDQLVKKMVRLALACEYARIPIRRADISAKVLGPNSRQFKTVFKEANLQLQTVFGMQLTELPLKEKVTAQQRRAAQKVEKAQTSSNTWIVTSSLPAKFKDPTILPPPRVPTSTTEAQYVALYSFIVSIISLSGGVLADPKLQRFLARMNADDTTVLGEKTEKTLARMVKENYLLKVVDSSGGEELVEWRVGARGKVEIGEEGVAGMVRAVYGAGKDEDEELEKRIERSLGLSERTTTNGVPNGNGQARRGRPRKDAVDDDD